VLPSIRTTGMVFHMKTTLVIDDRVMTRLREEAARRQTTLSELVEAALRLLLDAEGKRPEPLPQLPSFKSGGARVDVSDREALYRAMGGRG
jgi:hypothetical protein